MNLEGKRKMDLTIEQKYLLRLVLVAALILGAGCLGSESRHLVASALHRVDVIVGGLAQ